MFKVLNFIWHIIWAVRHAYEYYSMSGLRPTSMIKDSLTSQFSDGMKRSLEA